VPVRLADRPRTTTCRRPVRRPRPRRADRVGRALDVRDGSSGSGRAGTSRSRRRRGTPLEQPAHRLGERPEVHHVARASLSAPIAPRDPAGASDRASARTARPARRAVGRAPPDDRRRRR
jgi:hypothetical protein